MIDRIKPFEWNQTAVRLDKKLKNSCYTGHALRSKLLQMGLNVDSPVWNLPETYLDQVTHQIQKGKVPGTIFALREHNMIVNRNAHALIKINAYRGRRLKAGLPARGQTTRTNAKTAKKFNKFS